MPMKSNRSPKIYGNIWSSKST